MNKNIPAYLVEFFSTFALVFFGVGSIMIDMQTHGGFGIYGIATGHALALMICISAMGHISGGHINPAVTFAMFVTRRIKFAKALGYFCSQMLGAYYAAWFLGFFFPGDLAKSVLFGLPTLQNGMSYGSGLIIEALLTFFLVLAIFGSAVDERGPRVIAGLVIGLTVFIDILVGGLFTGACMNPARAFGPALLMGNWDNHSLYWIGPMTGAVLAALIYDNLLMKKNIQPV